MSKVLFITNMANKIGSFSISSITAAHDLGMEFYQIANWQNTDPSKIAVEEKTYDIKIKSIPISRNPFARTNWTAYRELIAFIKQENIDYIHCNTPTGGILGRLAGKKCKVKKIIYQAHGFHFYKGAPKKNWLLYYPIEKWLARYTDAVITINKEDFEFAKKKFKLRNHGKVYYVPGVGIDVAQYNLTENDRENKRRELGLSENDVALISMGDLIDRKNYDTAIRAVAEASEPALQYFICGKGPEEERLKELADNLGIAKQVHFLGFRSDIRELLNAADVFLFTTKQEGLPRSMMEAMASGLPCIASRIRGNTDLLDGTGGGFLCSPCDSKQFADAISKLSENRELREKMSKENLIKIKEYDISVVEKEIENIYSEVLNAEHTPQASV